MPIQAVCSGCQKQYRVKDDMDGKKFRCKVCQTVVLVEAFPEDEFEDLPLEPVAPKKNKKRKSTSFQLPSGLTLLGVLALLISLGFVVALITAPESVITIGWTMFGAGFVIMAVCHHRIGSKNERALSVLELLFPILAFAPIVRNFRENWPFLAAFVYGIALVLVGISLIRLG